MTSSRKSPICNPARTGSSLSDATKVVSREGLGNIVQSGLATKHYKNSRLKMLHSANATRNFALRILDKHAIHIIILTGFISLLGILKTEYAIGDGYWTPLRFLAYVSDLKSLTPHTIERLVALTVHNDSVKVLPSLLEVPFFLIYGKWVPQLSLAIGIILMIFLNCILYQTLTESTNSFYFKVLILACCILAYIHTDFLSRFSVVFASHRVIPMICLVASSKILFQRASTHTNNYILWPQAMYLSMLSSISLFSFASGSLLIPLTAGTFIVTGRIKMSIIFISITLPFFLVFLSFFQSDHMIRLSADSSHNISIASTITLFISYLTYLWSDPFYHLLSPKLASISAIAVSIFILLASLQKCSGDPLIATHSGATLNIVLKRCIFIAFYLALLFVFMLFQRAPSAVPDRYYVESIVFSIVSLVILLSVLKIPSNRVLFSCLLVYSSTMMSRSAYKIVHNHALPNSYYGDRPFVECLYGLSSVNSYSVGTLCHFNDIFYHFNPINNFDHPSIQIHSRDSYAKDIYRVFTGNKLTN